METAHNDHLVRKEYADKVVWPPTGLRPFYVGGLYRLFNTTLMFGIMALLEPDPMRTSELEKLLEEFLQNHRNRTDLCSRREFQIVSLFLAKIRSPRTVLCKHKLRTNLPEGNFEDSARLSESSVDEGSVNDGKDFAQSLFNHLGGFGHSTQFGVPNMVLDSQSSMQDSRFPYGTMPLSFDINRLDLNQVNSFFNVGGHQASLADAPQYQRYSQPIDGVAPFTTYASAGGSTAPFDVTLPAVDPITTCSVSPQQHTTSPNDLLLSPWSGLIDAIVSHE